jgi:peptidyl-prolyl cis-trans isomerase B (cyclophilin B)
VPLPRPATLCALALALACSGREAPEAPPADPVASSQALRRVTGGPHDVAVLDMGNLGEIRIELLREIAPKTVDNFVTLAEKGFFDGTYFHRVIPGFMIQGGDPNTKNNDPRDDGHGGPGYRLADELSDYPHVRGTVSMANFGTRNSAGSQFFIVQKDTFQLDGHYTVFGRVVEGMDVVDAITRLAIDKYGRYGPPDRPYPVDARIVSAHIEHASHGSARVASAAGAARPASPASPATATARAGRPPAAAR